MKTPQSHKGLYNSSLTRVYPLFGRLIAEDSTGLSWLPAILREARLANPQAHPLPPFTGALLPRCIEKRAISGNVLKYHGVDSLVLPACFERSIPPSYRFLRWLIEHPEKLVWPNHGKARFGAQAQVIREDLRGSHGVERQLAAQQEALSELERLGAQRAHGKWWSFEGATSVDCFLQTENLILIIEGKRTEPFSHSVNWYPGRNQLVRNLEVAQELAGATHFAVLVIAEKALGPLAQELIDLSLPHFSPGERRTLMGHYLGCLTWRKVCAAVGVPYESLPDTVPDYVASL